MSCAGNRGDFVNIYGLLTENGVQIKEIKGHIDDMPIGLNR